MTGFIFKLMLRGLLFDAKVVTANFFLKKTLTSPELELRYPSQPMTCQAPDFIPSPHLFLALLPTVTPFLTTPAKSQKPVALLRKPPGGNAVSHLPLLA